jgi:DNA mismatch endonuclease (patch repair protein)
MPTPRFTRFRPSSESASRIKASLPRLNTSAEIALRSSLWALGLRFRLHLRTLPGNPDIVLPRHRAVIFVDGDFWHGRHWTSRRERLERGSNPEYWVAKLADNIRRDRAVTRRLRRAGWRVIRVWESDIKRDAGAVATRIMRLLTAKVGPLRQARKRV